MSEKKRKSSSEKDDRPRKKAAVEQPQPQPAPTVKLTFLREADGSSPIVASAPGVSLSSSLTFKPYLKARPGHSKHETTIESSELMLHSSTHAKIDFTAREGESEVDRVLKHYVGVYDPETGELQVVEARKMVVRSCLRQLSSKSARSEVGTGSNGEDEEEKPSTAVGGHAQRTALTETFGSKRSRQAMQALSQNALLSTPGAAGGAPTALESALLSTVPRDPSSLTTFNPVEQRQSEIQSSKPLPKPNLSATTTSEVYPFRTLIPGGTNTLNQLSLSIRSWQSAAASDSDVTTSSRFVSRRLERIVKTTDNTTILQILRYILLLLDFNRSLRPYRNADGKRRGTKHLPARDELRRVLNGDNPNTISEPIISSLIRQFAPNSPTLSSFDITLLHTHMLALSLYIPPQGGNHTEELATDPNDLRDDLGLDQKNVLKYFRELGCRLDRPRESEFAKWGVRGGKAEAATRRIATLKLPLVFPKSTRGR